MMKKILLSLYFVLMATIASMSQFENEIDNVVIPEYVMPGEEVTVTFDYLAVDPGFFRFVISNNADQATFWDDDNFFGVNDWANLLDADPTGEWISASITFKIPAAIEPGERLFKLRLEESSGLNLLVGYDGTMEIAPSISFFSELVSYTATTEPVAIGSTIEVPIVYTSNFSTAQDLTFFFVSAGEDGGVINWNEAVEGDNTVPGNHGWVPINALTEGENVEYIAEVIVPTTIEFTSADLPEGQEWILGVRAFGVDLITETIIIGDYDPFLEITNIVAPTVAKIDTDIKISLDYINTSGEDLPVTIGLIRWNTANDEPAFDSDGAWQIAGFVEDLALLPSGDADEVLNEVVTFNISGTEAVASGNLPKGEEWRIMVRFNNVDDFNTAITLEPIEIGDRIEIISPIAGFVFGAGDTLMVEIAYFTKSDVEIELAIVLFEDEFTPVSPEVSVSEERFIVDLPASTELGMFTTVMDTLFVNGFNEFPTSDELSGTQNYQLVAKLLDPATTQTFLLHAISGRLEIVTGLFNNKSESASFNAYPNPSANGTVRFSTEISNMIVVDALGNVVETAESATELNTSSLESGFYLLKSDQGSVRLVVE